MDKGIHDSIEDFLGKYRSKNLHFLTTKATNLYTEVQYRDESFLIFGKETAGLPVKIHENFIKQRFKIPMIDNPNARSLNLSNSVNIVLYEALRQNHFRNMI